MLMVVRASLSMATDARSNEAQEQRMLQAGIVGRLGTLGIEVGRVVQIGTWTELRSNPASAFVEELVTLESNTAPVGAVSPG